MPFLPLAALLAAGPALAESLISLRDPAYGLGEIPGQARPVAARIGAIAYPVLGMPALVEPGRSFSVLLRPACAPDLAGLRAWAELPRLPELRAPLDVLALTRDDPAPGMARLTLRAPLELAAESWTLALSDGGCLRDRQPAALRVYHPAERARIAVLADEQLGDPTGQLGGGPGNGALYPNRGLEDRAARRRLQVREELELLDPLFVLYPGDLVFGMDYPAEYGQMAERLASARLAVFAVPGNHDAYTLVRASLRPGWQGGAHRLASCAGRLSLTSPVDGLGAVGACLIERLGDALEYRLESDGLQAFQRSMGPESYAFRVGRTRFVGLDSYGGSLERRRALPVSLGRLRDWLPFDLGDLGIDPQLGAPLVDNYGGFVEPATRAWLLAQADEARLAGESLVVFGHHDPSGLYQGQPAERVAAPFGTDPVGAGGFEVWNYEDGWDSDPSDGVARERPGAHTGSALVAALAGQEATWVCGHAHYDDDRAVTSLGAARLRVLQATTGGASLAHAAAYHGYRLIELGPEGLGAAALDSTRGWGSVPLGNFWTEAVPRPDGPPDRALVSGLPLPLQGRLRLDLPAEATGYRFTVSGPDGRAARVLPLQERALGAGRFTAWLPVEIPAARPKGPVAAAPAELARAVVRWERAPDNRPPVAVIAGGPDLAVRAGRPFALSGAGSADEAPLLAATWSIGGLEIPGLEAEACIGRPGRYPLRLRVLDAAGVAAEAEGELRVRRAWFRRRAGCAGEPG